MDIIQAAKAMQEGKKVRREVWPPGEMLTRSSHTTAIVWEKNREFAPVSVAALLATDWEIYQPTMSFREAMAKLNAGARVKRLEWGQLAFPSAAQKQYELLAIVDTEANDWVEIGQ